MATATRVTVIDGDGHIMENRGRHIELLEEPYRGFRSVHHRVVGAGAPGWHRPQPGHAPEQRQREDLSESQRETLLHGTAARFYGLNG